jgi:sec-independent protein translocase protein TatA
VFHLGTIELIVILVIVIVLFGAGRIGKIAGELGKGARDFQSGLKGVEETKGSNESKDGESKPY